MGMIYRFIALVTMFVRAEHLNKISLVVCYWV